RQPPAFSKRRTFRSPATRARASSAATRRPTIRPWCASPSTGATSSSSRARRSRTSSQSSRRSTPRSGSTRHETHPTMRSLYGRKKGAGVKLLLKLDGTAASGGSPLVMHNERLADPLDPFARDIAKVSKKRNKTEADHLEIARLEFLGGM